MDTEPLRDLALGGETFTGLPGAAQDAVTKLVGDTLGAGAGAGGSGGGGSQVRLRGSNWPDQFYRTVRAVSK